MDDDDQGVEYGPRTLAAMIDELATRLPLRWRELHFEVLMPEETLQRGARVAVCTDGHVHVYFGAVTSVTSYLIDGVLAYVFASIIDTKPQPPRRPGKKSITKRIDAAQTVVEEFDPALAILIGANMATLRRWVDEYVEARTGRPLKRTRSPQEPAQPPPRRREPIAVPVVPEPALDLGPSTMIWTPGGHVMFGVLNIPLEVGDA